jgi:hypothetical protein
MNNAGNNPVIKNISQNILGNDLLISITVDRKIYEPFAPASICDITTNQKNICDLYHYLKYENNIYKFIVYNYNTFYDFDLENKYYAYIQWFTPDQLDYIKTKTYEWTLRKYDISNDHEHCIICWKTISIYDEAENKGYKYHSKNVWMCEECFIKYIVNKFSEKLKI